MLFCPGRGCSFIASLRPYCLTEYYAFCLPQLDSCQTCYPDKEAVPRSYELSWILAPKPLRSLWALRCVLLCSNGAEAHCRLQPHCRSNSSYCRLLTQCQVHDSAFSGTQSDLWYSPAKNHGTMDSAIYTAVLSLTQLHSAIVLFLNKPH
jgi:hypothetical protein